MKYVSKGAVSAAILAAGMVVAGTASAVPFYGTPSPSLSPTFGTLIDFDDQPTGTSIGAYDYVSMGLASITETTGAGAAFARYGSSQSSPNYIGTGSSYEIGGANLGWDGTILFEFASLADMVGLGVADSQGGPEIYSIFDSNMNLLESFTAQTGANTYAGFDRSGLWDIKYLQISGDFFAVDDLQFTAMSVPEPGTLALFGISLLGMYGAHRRKANS